MKRAAQQQERRALSDEAEVVVEFLRRPHTTLTPTGMTGLWWMVWDGARSYGAAFPRAVADEILQAEYLTEKRGVLKQWVRTAKVVP